MSKLLALASRYKLTNPYLAIILSTVGFIALNLLFGLSTQKLLVGSALFAGENFLEKSTFNTIGMILTFGPIALLLFLYIKKVEKREIPSIGFTKGEHLSFLKGGIIGMIMVSMVSLIMVVLGQAKITPALDAYKTLPSLFGFILLFIGRMVQASTEEIIFRGWLLPNLSLKWGVPLGVIVSSFAFGIIHAFTNPSLLAVLNLTLYGVFLSLYALNEGNIWGACGWHTLWNWTEGSVFGISENGNGANNGLFFNVDIKGSQLLTGGELGSNASLILTVVLTIGIVFQLLNYSKRSKKTI